MKNHKIVDKIPFDLNYGEFSQIPVEITEHDDSEVFMWNIEEIHPGERLEITYLLNGDYSLIMKLPNYSQYTI